MALFETMRENMKVILWVTVIAFVALIFLAWGADFATRSGGKRAEAGLLGRVNGDPLYAQEYSQLYEQMRTSYEGETSQPLDEASMVMLEANTWQRMVDGTLMRQMARDNDILVTDEEIANALLYAPLPRFRALAAFQNEQGQFDPQRYQSWVTDPQTNTLPLEAEYREMLMAQKLQLVIFSAVKVSEEEVRSAWMRRNRTVDIGYSQVPYYKITRDEKIEDAVLEEYLRENSDRFRAPARVALEYIRIEKRPTTEDSLEARNQIGEVLRDLQRGEEFLPLVQSYSEASRDRWGGAAAKAFTREELTPPALRDAAFTLPPGQVSDVIASAEGLHLLRVEERTIEEGVEKVKIAEIFIPIRASYETNFALQDRMLDLVDSTGTTEFGAAAQAADLPLQNTGPFDPEGFVPGLGRVVAAQEFARTAEVGQTSRPVQTVDAWYVFHLAQRLPPALPPMEEIRRQVRNAYLQENRQEGAVARAQAVLDRALAGLPLERASALDSMAAFNVVENVSEQGSVRGLGYDPKLNVALFQAQQAGLIPRVIVGNQAAFVVEILDPPTFDEAAFETDKEQLRRQLLQEKQNQAATQWMERIRKEADIQDYRPVIASM
ncbi:MAG: SurA N-terminal domain-containing protein [Candidatus Eisenbacteria bacterium]